MEWFNKVPGSLPMQQEEDGSFITLVGGEPDVLRLPAELGGGISKVLGVFWAPCPVNPTERPSVKHYSLENSLYMAESDKFYWYKK